MGRPPSKGQKRNKPLQVLLTPSEHEFIANLARQSGRTLSNEVKQRLQATFSNPAWEKPTAEAAIQILTDAGWLQHYEARHGGNVLLPPGATPSSPFFIDGRELTPSIDASESVEKVLRGVFHEFGIPPEQRIPLREALFEALNKIVPKEKGGEWRGKKRTPRVA